RCADAGWHRLQTCAAATANLPAKLDEAAETAKKKNTAPAEFARQHYYPREIQDYFKEMDQVARRTTAENGQPKPHQLLDKLAIDPPALENPITRPEKGDPDFEAKARLHDSEVLGRNSWMIWCAGNEGFWDWLATDAFGFIDLLKLIDSRNRAARFRDAGMINEPGMGQAPAQGEFGLWLDLAGREEVRKWRAAYVAEAFGDSARTWSAARERRYGARSGGSSSGGGVYATGSGGGVAAQAGSE
ncbi:MAG: hypothetical protein M3463_18185, partial [Verrucomicrobiota bacterium]|nr:hypothetical protein [Verrucomicrobiota bacterium]